MSTVQVPADQVITIPGPAKIEVYGSTPGVQSAQPAPTVTTLTPNTLAHGAAASALTVTGTNFNPGSKILWGGAPVDTVFVSATSLTTVLTAAQLAAAATVVVKARNGSVDSAAGQSFTIS